MTKIKKWNLSFKNHKIMEILYYKSFNLKSHQWIRLKKVIQCFPYKFQLYLRHQWDNNPKNIQLKVSQFKKNLKLIMKRFRLIVHRGEKSKNRSLQVQNVPNIIEKRIKFLKTDFHNQIWIIAVQEWIWMRLVLSDYL